MTDTAPGPLHALILAGGRSSRLGGVAKAGLLIGGQTLLARTLDAVVGILANRTVGLQQTFPLDSLQFLAPTASRDPALADRTGPAEGGIAVVGPVEHIADWLEGAKARSKVMTVQENPPFSGPAAGIAAGIGALNAERGHVLILACDMPRAGAVAQLLVDALDGCPPGQGVMAVAAGKKQPLAAIYPLLELQAATDRAREAHRLDNASVFALVANVFMRDLAVPAELTADIDTWADARAQGIAARAAGAEG